MADKKTLSSSILGLSGSMLSSLGVGAAACCAGPGAAICGTACAPVCGATLASFLGISSSAIASWANHLLPIFIAVSAVAFTIGYYRLYNQKKEICCDTTESNNTCCDSQQSTCNETPNQFNKVVFWSSLVITILFYGYTFASNVQNDVDKTFSQVNLTEVTDSNTLTTDTIPTKPSCCKAKVSKCCSSKSKKGCSPKR